MPLQSASQWDALGHVFYDDQLYNGFSASENITPHGAHHCSITAIAKGVTGRGVLLDIARLKGVEWLEAGYAITPADLDEAAAAHGVTVGSGDILLFRTGWRRKFLAEGDPTSFMTGEPGLGLACAEWLQRPRGGRRCARTTGRSRCSPARSRARSCRVHMVLIRDMGMTLGEILDFEELSADCAEDGVYEFFFCGPPIKFTRAVGSPINPLAIK